MDVLTDDHEREEAVKKWWHEYWKPLTLGVVIALAGLLGWRQYQNYQLEAHQEQAYAVFQIQLQLQQHGAAALPQAEEYMQQNEDVFGSVLALDAAAVQIANRDYEGAAKSIDFVKKNGGELLMPSAVLTEARLLNQSGKPADALKVLDGLTNKAYAAEAYEVRGDIELSQGNREAARDAYDKAIKELQGRDMPVSPILLMKFDDVIAAGDSPAYILSLPEDAQEAIKAQQQ